MPRGRDETLPTARQEDASVTSGWRMRACCSGCVAIPSANGPPVPIGTGRRTADTFHHRGPPVSARFAGSVPARRERPKKRPPPSWRGPFALVVRGGVEPPTFHFSGGRSYQLSYLTKRGKRYMNWGARRQSAMLVDDRQGDAQPQPHACSRSSSMPKWWAISCTTVIRTSSISSSTSRHMRTRGPWKIRIRSGAVKV